MKIYLTRHGETEWNIKGIMQGWNDSSLTERGIRDAEKLGQRLKDIKFDKIYSSPLGRAMDTSKYITGNDGREIIILEDLKEMGFGVWEGMPKDKVTELYHKEYYDYWNKPHLYKTVEGETFEELFNRVKTVLEYITKEGKENILVVSHAVVIKTIYAIIKGYAMEEFWAPPFLEGTSLTIIEAKNNKMEITMEADISHLE